jgi:hypothetical protein
MIGNLSTIPGMAETDHPTAPALREAFEKAGSRVSLMEKLNERGHQISAIGVISQWLKNGVPARYCPDIEELTGVSCERLCPDVKWGLVRDRRAEKRQPARAGVR